MRPAVFLDRDGTIIEEVNYCSRPEDVQVIPGAAQAIRMLRDAGYLVIVATNQSGIGRGYYTESDYRLVDAEMRRQLTPVEVDAVYFCADTPDKAGPRRKPNPGMVLEAAADFGIDLARSYFVGDRDGDIGAGRNAGTRTVLVRTGYGPNVDAAQAGPDFIAADLLAAADWILEDARAAREAAR